MQYLNMRQTKLLIALSLSFGISTSAVMADDNQSHHRTHRSQHDRQHGHRSTYTNGIRNLREVHPWLFRGGQPPVESFKTLYEMGVTTVVDLRDRTSEADKEKSLCKQFGMNLVKIPLSHRTKPTKGQIDQFLKVVDTARQHTGKGSVFVHCEMGDDRTGCMVAISRMAFDDYSYQEAYEEMLHFGFHRHFDTLTSAVKEFAEQNKKVTSK